MTDLDPPDPDDHDGPFGPGGIPDDVRATGELLLERFQGLDDELRQIGLYIEGHPQVAIVNGPTGPKVGLLCHWQIGRVAFSARVQNPEADQFDRTFDVMAVEAADDSFLDERQRIQRLLAEGKTLEEIMALEEDDEPDPDPG